MNIAMWSGPRNLSTAMMYAFAQRDDCAVIDEPYYAAYLDLSGSDHPLRDEIIAAGETDPDRVAALCASPAPDRSAHFYQKHMTHHMLPGMDLDWMERVANAFLIRHPHRVVASYERKRQNPTLEDIGFERQLDLIRHVQGLGQRPIVVDSDDILQQPEQMLKALCSALTIDFDPAMLSWAGGGRPEDGVWASHWYGAIHRSEGFGDPPGPVPGLDGDLAAVADAAMPLYDEMQRFALSAD